MRHVILSSLFGGVAIWIYIATINGASFPFVKNTNQAFYALLIVGFVMCAVSRLTTLKPREWLTPSIIFAIIVGLALLALTTLQILRHTSDMEISWIKDDLHAFKWLALLILLKWGFATARFAYTKIAIIGR